MRIHIVGYPHTNTDGSTHMCGFTNKTIRFCKMMKHMGNQVFLYGGVKNSAPCDEFISCVNEYEQIWVRELKHYIYPSWNPGHTVWKLFNSRVAREIKQRGQIGDIVTVLGGSIFKQLEKELPGYYVVENGIGYYGYGLKYKIWESKAWKELNAASPHDYPPQPEDPIIHGFFDENEFELGQDSGYLLYVGRVTEQKGVCLCCEAAARAGKPLFVAGYGEKNLVTHGARYLGEVSMKERNRLMAGADALMCPSQKFEAFGNIVPEAGMCGTRVLASDMGAFRETVLDGFTGFRAKDVNDMVDKIRMRFTLGDRAAIRQSAIERFSMWKLCHRYQELFERLSKTGHW